MTTDHPDAEALWSRLRQIINQALAGLTPEDREWRIQWCREHDTHGIRAHFDDPDTVRLEWGGARLAVIDRQILLDDTVPYAEVFMSDYDGVPTEWLNQDDGSK